MPAHHLGMEFFRHPLLDNHSFQQNMFGGFAHQWDSNVASYSNVASTSGIGNPISAIGQLSATAAQQVAQSDTETENFEEMRYEQGNYQIWYSDFEEIKNAEKKKVNIISFVF